MYSWELVVFWQGFKRLITESRAKMVIKHYVFISFVFIFDSGFDWRWVSPTFLMYFTILCIVFMHLVSLISYLLCFQLKLYSLHTILLFLNLTTANKYNFLPFDFILNIQISKPSPLWGSRAENRRAHGGFPNEPPIFFPRHCMSQPSAQQQPPQGTTTCTLTGGSWHSSLHTALHFTLKSGAFRMSISLIAKDV